MSEVYSCRDPQQRAAGFAAAKTALQASGLVVLPTDTVYGIAADAFDPTGVRRLLRAKARGRGMPPPVLIGDVDTMHALTDDIGSQVRALMEAFWPGGLTIICRQQSSLRWDLGDTRGTVGVRMPNHPDALEVLEQNGPLAVSSANISGQDPTTTVDEAQDMLDDVVDVFLDGGPTPGPVASTIIDATGDTLTIVRVGVVTLDQITAVVPEVDAGVAVGTSHAPVDADEQPQEDVEQPSADRSTSEPDA